MIGVIAILLALILFALINRKAAAWTLAIAAGCGSLLFSIFLALAAGVGASQALAYEHPAVRWPIAAAAGIATFAAYTFVANWIARLLFPNHYFKLDQRERERQATRERIKREFERARQIRDEPYD